MHTRAAAVDSSGLPKDVVTRAIRDFDHGVPGASDRLWELVYPWFHRLARLLLAHDALRLQMEPEDLLHDAIHRVDLDYLHGQDVTRAHLCRWVLQAMRWVLVDCSRRMRVRRDHLAERDGAADERAADLSPLVRADLQDRLDRLAQCDKAAFHVLELWLSGDRTLAEIAAVQGYSASKAGALLQGAFERMRAMDGDAALPARGDASD
jgi:DNA-directed RNA polymerase specialized sigma24 family protein